MLCCYLVEKILIIKILLLTHFNSVKFLSKVVKPLSSTLWRHHQILFLRLEVLPLDYRLFELCLSKFSWLFHQETILIRPCWKFIVGNTSVLINRNLSRLKKKHIVVYFKSKIFFSIQCILNIKVYIVAPLTPPYWTYEILFVSRSPLICLGYQASEFFLKFLLDNITLRTRR